MSEREKILADLSAYLDGELPPAQAQRVEGELAQDSELAKEFADLCPA
jgi:anti-sigma factor RsiW